MNLANALEKHDLTRIAPTLQGYVEPSVAFWFSGPVGSPASSKIGGRPDLPPGFRWPERKNGRKLDFLLQLRTDEVRAVDPAVLLPEASILSFFYDLEEQPWGYDPQRLDGFHVALFPAAGTVPVDVPNPEIELAELEIELGRGLTLPHSGSRQLAALSERADFTDEEWERYSELQLEFESSFYPEGSGLHRLFGHSANVQGDMQLEAQLVSHGLYCGDESGYEDPRRPELEKGASDWKLLLQLDSDDRANVMWGDLGMLYYLIRIDDLVSARFDRVWMTLQCG